MFEKLSAKNSILLLLPLVVFGVLIFFLYDNLGKNSEHLETALLNRPLPEFSAKVLNSQVQVSSQQFQGPALINVWATWCPSCYAEHATLLKLKANGVKIYGINYRDDDLAAIQFIEKLGDPFELIVVDQQADIGFELGVYGAPETFFLGRDNKIKYRHVGEINERIWRDKLSQVYDAL